MPAILGSLLLSAAKSIMMKLLAKELVESLLIEILEWMAAKSDNKLDDKAVALVKEQLEKN